MKHLPLFLKYSAPSTANVAMRSRAKATHPAAEDADSWKQFFLPGWRGSSRCTLASFASSPERPTEQETSEELGTKSQLWTDRRPEESLLYFRLPGVRTSFWSDQRRLGSGYQPPDSQLIFIMLSSLHTADKSGALPVSRNRVWRGRWFDVKVTRQFFFKPFFGFVFSPLFTTLTCHNETDNCIVMILITAHVTSVISCILKCDIDQFQAHITWCQPTWCCILRAERDTAHIQSVLGRIHKVFLLVKQDRGIKVITTVPMNLQTLCTLWWIEPAW